MGSEESAMPTLHLRLEVFGLPSGWNSVVILEREGPQIMAVIRFPTSQVGERAQMDLFLRKSFNWLFLGELS